MAKRTLSSVPDRKISETFLQFAEPLLPDLPSEAPERRARDALQVSFTAWNAVIFADVLNDETYLNEIRRLTADKPETAFLVEQMIARKRALFADDAFDRNPASASQSRVVVALLGARAGSPPPGTHPRSWMRGAGAPTAPRAPGRRHPPSPGTAPASRQPGAMLFWRPRCDRAVTSAVRGGIPAIRENQEGGKHAS